jgi:hypothetical protein
MKENAQSYKWKNYYGKKVWSVNADDIEWFECEHVHKTHFITQLDSKINELKQQLALTQNNNESKAQKLNPRLKT